MIRIAAIVEGFTEQNFVSSILAPHLGLSGVELSAVLAISRNQGGAPKWSRIRSDVLRTIASGKYCTTMLDLYGLPSGWPGAGSPAKDVEAVEQAMLEDLPEADRYRFVPYVQKHEFEALLFADVGEIAAVFSTFRGRNEQSDKNALNKIVRSFANPEEINDGYATCPSRRITSLAPGWSKSLHGTIVANRIGIERMREKCPHFADWLKRLEALK